MNKKYVLCGVGDYNITADSKPDYDDWGIDSYWGAIHWEQWYYALKQRYGAAHAKQIWAAAVEKVDSFEAFNTYRYDRRFWDFMKKEGLLEIGSNSIADAVMRSGSVVDSAGAGLDNIFKMAKFVLPVGLAIYGLDKFGVFDAIKKNRK